jgi:DNA-binding response OmpR family regulator
MPRPTLAGRSILIVEDEALIVMDLTMALENTGAQVTSTNTLKHALLLVEHDGLAAAILDHALGDGNSSLLYKRLKERGIPFLIYSGHSKSEAAKQGAPYISKPASHEVLVAGVEDLIRSAENSNGA